jgi:threonine/homoserine/homoserine lactone efflux protein
MSTEKSFGSARASVQRIGGNMSFQSGLRKGFERVIRFVVGPLLVFGGLWFIALAFAFATLADDPDAPFSWVDYLGVVFHGGASSIAIGLVMIIGGIYLAASRRPSPDQGDETQKQ